MSDKKKQKIQFVKPEDQAIATPVPDGQASSDYIDPVEEVQESAPSVESVPVPVTHTDKNGITTHSVYVP